MSETCRTRPFVHFSGIFIASSFPWEGKAVLPEGQLKQTHHELKNNQLDQLIEMFLALFGTICLLTSHNLANKVQSLHICNNSTNKRKKVC